MSRKLKDINIRMISLVRAGANQKEIVYKNEKMQTQLAINFSKADDEQGVVYGIVYAPDEIDTQGDTANATEILKASYLFMKNGNMSWCVDIEHSLENIDAYVCESWIVKESDPFFKEVGAWAVGIKVEDEAIKEAIKNGEIKGLSMYGTGTIDGAETKKSLVDTIKEVLKSWGIIEPKQEIEKKEIIKMDETRIKELVATAVADMTKKVDEFIVAQKEAMDGLKAEISKSQQSKELPVSKSNTGGIL